MVQESMDWTDHAIVLNSRPHGETGLVVNLLTSAHGRHAGFVPGGVSRKARPVWQSGNVVEVEWRARVAEQLGNYRGELREPHAAKAMDSAAELAAVAFRVRDAASAFRRMVGENGLAQREVPRIAYRSAADERRRDGINDLSDLSPIRHRQIEHPLHLRLEEQRHRGDHDGPRPRSRPIVKLGSSSSSRASSSATGCGPSRSATSRWESRRR